MADPVTVLAQRFSQAMAAAFGPEHAGTDPVLRRSAQERFGDYQANGAMALGKALGRSPRDVAAELIGHLDLTGIAEPPEVAGPGFVNIRLLPGYLSEAAGRLAADERLCVDAAERPETVVVDYSQPNVAKEMHVGHLRSTVIGDAIVRVLEFLGHRVIRQNHLGDWGTNFGMLIEHLVDLGEEETAAELSLGDLEAFYQQAKAKYDSDPAFAERARLRVVALQSGDPPTLKRWHLLIDQSTRYFSAVYELLNVRLTDDDVAGESFYNSMLDDVAAELEAKGLAVVDDGALCVFPPGFAGRDGKPFPLMVRKRDGGYGYDATDLAAIRYRVRELGADRIVYVVDARQSQHFALLFAAARMAGWLDGGRRAEHVAFGSVLGPDGRPFKTRVGGTVKLIALLEEAVERATVIVTDKRPDLDEAERAAVARAVGVGALKYADLSNDRAKDYVFDFDRMLAMDGNTAPYLQYAHARVCSILRRAAEEGAPYDPAAGSAVVIGEPAERALVLQLLSLDVVVRQTADSLQPHRLTTYLYDLAAAFTAFFEHCPVLRAATPELRASRLVLCDLTARTLRLGLGLLGIEAPERM
ncbi:MAG TPA: arginine--tRNA ligase [Acidimicrobiales bacterium]|nr:arginine--tRNA ligase [Acidimicrobiales bacterium]